MRKSSPTHHVLLCACLALAPWRLHAQSNLGLASGNYAGISGAWLNPASIVDSRYKFDMALYGYESYFSNNALLMSNKVLRDRLFSRSPYNTSHQQAVNDLLTPLDDLPEKVEGALVSEIQPRSRSWRARAMAPPSG